MVKFNHFWMIEKLNNIVNSLAGLFKCTKTATVNLKIDVIENIQQLNAQ